MKLPSKFIATSLVAVTLGLASANTMANTVPVKFKAGASGATYSNKIRGYNYTDYTFYAKKGQTLTTIVTGHVDAILFGKNIDSVDLSEDPSYTLPVTGSYEIRVLQNRAFARQGKTPNYTLQMTIR